MIKVKWVKRQPDTPSTKQITQVNPQKISKKEATDENDLDFAIAVFRVGTHIDNEENRSDRVGTYRGIRAAR